ncbi:ATP-binding protein [Dactylosporangium vinaceum]|uniref:Protein DpdH n=1 Tax=Dactylosporangium vinaceum TaxID=53362 RepID=A0ABV5MLG0_9ACTN|nr:protein DpdH [Dactylosporangium vinaceum]UAB96970.1 ATP-binding protein [Dactylosporangium vinaceum]
MAEFRQYVCWSPVTAATTISTEAVSPSPSVFFATHVPLRIRRRHPEAKAEGLGTAVTEEQVRRDFLGRPTANGVLLMPVTGESGTGKSHLVRWVQEKTPSTDKRLVIHLPKTSTSLRAVVRTLLDQPGADTAELAQLRADVDRMSSELDVDSLQRRLINELSEAVTVADAKPGAARVLAGPDKLALLLLDPHVRDHLLQPGKLIPRLAASLLSDRRDREGDRPATFSLTDLPLDIADVNKASDKAKRLLSLITSRPELQTAAVEILTDQLPVAVTAAWNMGGGRLQQAMLEIRRQLAQQDKEIVLLIEDFVVLQGVQRDLLDALIEAGVRGGKTELAPVRTLMAVTSGYWERLEETVLTRAKAATPYLYNLDAALDIDEQGQEDISIFVGRYLNAARVGQEALDNANVAAGAEVPNRCKTCDFQETCHSAFGASAEGYGLYPFNWPALRRAIRARPAHDSPDTFNPRAVIGEVIRPVLVDHAQALNGGTFPDQRFREDYPTAEDEEFLLGAVQREIEERDSGDASRRKTFLEFWGDAPRNLTNLEPEIHHAFGVSLLALDDVVGNASQSATRKPDEPASARRTGVRTATGELPRAIAVMIEHVEEWQGRQSQLPQGTAAYLRNIIRQAVINRCLWTDPVMAEPLITELDRAWPLNSTVVSIEDAGGERLPGTADAPIRFNRNSGNATFFRQLLLAGTDVAGNAAAVRRLREITELHQKNLQQAAQRYRQVTDKDLVLGIRASLLGAALAGRAWPGMKDVDLLDASFADGIGWKRADSSSRTPQWNSLQGMHQNGRGILTERLKVGVGFTRGKTGGVRIIDGTRALPLVRQAAQEWTWRKPESPLPPWVDKAVSGFHQFTAVIDAQCALLQQNIVTIRTFLPSGVSGSETVAAVDQAYRAAVGEGLGPEDLTAFQALLADARQADWRCIERAERDLARAAAAEDDESRSRATLAACAVDRGEDLAVIERFLVASDSWLTKRLQQARLRGGGSGESAVLRVQELLRQWMEVDG